MLIKIRFCDAIGPSDCKTNLKQGAHIHQPTVWAVPHACAQPYYSGSGSHGQLFRPYWGSSAWHSCRVNERGKSPCIKDPSGGTVVGSIATIIGDEFPQVAWVYLKVW